MSTIEELEKRIWNDIGTFGWHVIKIQEDTHGPSMVYSIGLFHSFEHPEVLVIGLDIEAAHALINRIGNAVRDGVQFESGQFYTNLIESQDCYFTSIDPRFYQEYVGYAKHFYREKDFPLLQCIYPTLTGIYPWQKTWPEQLRQKQPVLGSLPSESQGEEEMPIAKLG